MPCQAAECREGGTDSISEQVDNQCISVKLDTPDTFVSHFKVSFAFQKLILIKLIFQNNSQNGEQLL